MSSSYSKHGSQHIVSVARIVYGFRGICYTFFSIISVDCEVEVGAITKATLDDDITLELEDRYARSIKLYSRRLLLGLELEKH